MRLFAPLFLSWSLLVGHAMATTEKIIYGYIEKVTLVDQDLTLSAKLDTGASSASLNATDIVETEKDGLPFLNFKVPSKQGDVFFTCEYVGKVKIKIRAGEKHISPSLKKSIKRPVVLMRVRMADKERVIRVNLTNRKRFIYPLLLGREAIVAFNGLVDPGLTFTLKGSPTK